MFCFRRFCFGKKRSEVSISEVSIVHFADDTCFWHIVIRKNKNSQILMHNRKYKIILGLKSQC